MNKKQLHFARSVQTAVPGVVCGYAFVFYPVSAVPLLADNCHSSSTTSRYSFHKTLSSFGVGESDSQDYSTLRLMKVSQS